MSRAWWRTTLVSCLMAVPTWFLFGLQGGWHRIYVFGIFRYMMWQGEDPSPVHFTWNSERIEVVLSPWRLLLTVFVWFVAFSIVLLLVLEGTRDTRKS